MYNRTAWAEGTPQNAANFNNMEAGISDVSVAMALTQNARSKLPLIVEQGYITLTGDVISITRRVPCGYIKNTSYSLPLDQPDTAAISVKVYMGGVDITGSAVKQTGTRSATVTIFGVTADVLIRVDSIKKEGGPGYV